MKIVVAPDSFKGSLSAREVCQSIKNGILGIFPNASIIDIPLADGGEGTMENLVYATSGTIIAAKVQNPLGKLVDSEFFSIVPGPCTLEEAFDNSSEWISNKTEQLMYLLKQMQSGSGLI